MAIRSLEELKKIKEENKDRVNLRYNENYSSGQIEILVGMATCGIAAGARETLNAITQELRRRNIDHVRVVPVGCLGYCKFEPLIVVNIPGDPPCAYGNIGRDQVPEIIQSHVIEHKPVDRLIVGIDFGRIP